MTQEIPDGYFMMGLRRSQPSLSTVRCSQRAAITRRWYDTQGSLLRREEIKSVGLT
jgi:hypothetical protein